MAFKRFLGIDYGTKRIGIAISDEQGVLAFPREIIINNHNSLKKIGEIIKKENISDIVVGESTDFSGAPNVLSSKIAIFVSELEEKFKLPVYKQKEFLTSVEARKVGQNKENYNKSQTHNRIKKEKNKKVDASAAALILQRYLDKMDKHHKKYVL